MKSHLPLLRLLVPPLVLMTSVAAQAQETPPPPANDPSLSHARPASPRNVQAIVNQLGRETGAHILVTSDLAEEIATPPSSAVTVGTLEESLTALVRGIPLTTWAKAYLPAPASGRRYTGDALAQFAAAETALFGRQEKPVPGTIVLLGKRMSAAEAEPYIEGLKLEPYYVILRRRALTSPLLENPAASRPRDPVTEALLKQLGLTDAREIPSGDYVVPVVGPDGTARTAHVKVTNAQGQRRFEVYLTQEGNQP